jgi:serine/threonine protein kinase
VLAAYSDYITQRLCREALVWRQLQHPNILRFLGLNWSLFPHDALPSLLAPWMEYGTLKDYVEGPIYDPTRSVLQLVCFQALYGGTR